MIGSRQKLQMAAAGASFVPPSTAWNVAAATYNGSPINWFSVLLQDNSPQGVFFKDDGTKMYVLGSSADRVNEYNLGTAWEVSTASFVQFFSIQAQDATPTGLFFKPDGTKMYVVGSGADRVNEYNLGTAWDLSTASFWQFFSVSAQEAVPTDIFFKPDGTKMYVVGSAGDDVNEYDLSTAWSVITASFVQTFSVSAQELIPNGLFFKDDGTKMYVMGTSGDDVNEYNLSTAWNVSTASFVQVFSVAGQEAFPNGLFFKPDGTKMYVVGLTASSVTQYDLSTAWDVSTAVFIAPTTGYFSVLAQEANPQAVFLKPDGTKMYILGSTGDDVNEYDLSTAWEVSTASFVQTFSVGAQELIPNGLFFKPDGAKMYVTGSNGDDVNEYDLGTAWNVSTASFVQTFSVFAQESGPTGVFFKDDGTKMYVVGNAADRVSEYNLSTAWNVSTASFVQVFSVSAQESNPQDIFFKDDGTKMYILGATGSDVNEYNLGTAWDVSTATYLRNFSVIEQESSPSGLFFKSDGTKMYIVGTLRDVVFSYDL